MTGLILKIHSLKLNWLSGTKKINY